MDAHVYLMDRWILEHIQTKSKTLSSVKRELIPHLVKLQNHSPLSSATTLDVSVANKQQGLVVS